MRNRVAALVLACAGVQLAPGDALLASALTLGLHAGDHAHEVLLVTDERHVHLVLSHDERGHDDRPDARHDRPGATSERDHVYHVTDDEAAGTAPRRAGVPPSPAAASAVAVLPAPLPVWVQRPALEPRARSSDPLRTVVLRL